MKHVRYVIAAFGEQHVKPNVLQDANPLIVIYSQAHALNVMRVSGVIHVVKHVVRIVIQQLRVVI
jgi:hypothetical protein